MEIKPWERLAKDQNKKLRSYNLSTTERLLEEICESFGTTLEQAYLNPINGAKLVRVSKPVVVSHKITKERKLLQFQFTKFSPFSGTEKWEEVWIQNKKLDRPRSRKRYEYVGGEVDAEIKEKYGEFDAFLSVTNSHYVPHLSLHRFEKSLCFAVFDVPNRELSGKELKPFEIHEFGRPPYQWDHESSPPIFWIKYHRRPYFLIGQTRSVPEDEYDFLAIDFPKIHITHSNAIEKAFKLYSLERPVGGYKEKTVVKKDYTRSLYFPVYHDAEPTQIMGFIQQYLKQICLGRTL